jgi:hypothetical protein
VSDNDPSTATYITSQLLSGLNDGLAVTPYGHGHLVSLPLFFYDNDRVKLFIEQLEGGVRVTDRGTTAMRLAMAEVNLTSKRAEDALRQSVVGDLFGVAVEGGEIAGFGGNEELANLIYAVASAALRVDQLRWLAVERRPIAFRDRVVDELVHVVGTKDRVTPHAPIALRSGRTKQVTASILPRQANQDATPLYVQALSGQDSDSRENAVARCFHLFSLARTSQEHLVAVASGTRDTWPPSLIDEVSQVASVAFFDEEGSVASTVGRKLASVGA